MNIIGNFHLSTNLPLQEPGQKNPDQPTYDKEKIESIIRSLLGKNTSIMTPDNSKILLHFFETMIIDKDWISKNNATANQVIKAVSYYFLNCDNSTITEKIKNIVQGKWSFSTNTFADLELQVVNEVSDSKGPPAEKTSKPISLSFLLIHPFLKRYSGIN